MRHTTSITTVSWIPSDALRGLSELGEKIGFVHHDEPPPTNVGLPGDGVVEAMRDADAFRFANRLQAWIDVDGGRITAHGCDGGLLMGATTVRVGGRAVTVPGIGLPDLRPQPELGEGEVRFRQTVGGRTGVPAPRPVRRPPFVQYRAPVVWTTVEIVIRADGTSGAELVGASPFPRHWVYDDTGQLVGKSGLAQYKQWWTKAFGRSTPWGDLDQPALVTPAESALEHELSGQIMKGVDRRVRRVRAGAVLVRQGDLSTEVYLLLDGVLRVDVDGTPLAELGPGSVVGERAALEGGARTATLTALTPVTVAVTTPEAVGVDVLAPLVSEHRREETQRQDEPPPN